MPNHSYTREAKKTVCDGWLRSAVKFEYAAFDFVEGSAKLQTRLVPSPGYISTPLMDTLRADSLADKASRS